MPKRQKSKYAIRTVSRALELLEQFHDENSEMGVTELSRLMQLHKNNVFRLLATLQSRGYIEQNGVAANYRLGLKTLELGQTFLKQTKLLSRSRPVLERLVTECNETMYVALMRDATIVYVDMVETSLPVRVVPRVGARLPAYCTAAGKVQLAYMTEEEMDSNLPKELEPRTRHTITDRRLLKKQFRQIVRCGYAIDDEELDLDVRCVSAPLRDHTRRIIGAVSISGPAMRFSDERLKKELIPLVRKAKDEISAALGYRKERPTASRTKTNARPARATQIVAFQAAAGLPGQATADLSL